jgi:hypothetical protein
MSSSQENQKPTLYKKADGTVEVLYQKMGDRWFAFSLVDDEMFIGSITQNEIDTDAYPSRDAFKPHY